eukprot:14186499-Alexandrium_andersonii.AAC.1
MNSAPHIQLCIVKAACVGLASGKPEALEDLCVERFPTGRGSPSAIETAPKLGAHPRLGHIRRERHTHVLINERMQ